jgi:SnoaL-like domain
MAPVSLGLKGEAFLVVAENTEPMSNADHLLQALQPVFGEAERVVDEELIDQTIAALDRIGAPEISGSMNAGAGFQIDFDDFEGLRKAWADWLGAFAAVRIEIEDVEEIGDNVLTMVKQSGKTRHGVELTQPSAAVWKFRDGLVVRVGFHLDREAAIESASEPL